jgi:hypothetical protein
MLDSGVSFVMAFSDKVEDGLAGGSGTEDCLRQAMRRGISFVVISHDPRN